jgi:hypothetical protein
MSHASASRVIVVIAALAIAMAGSGCGRLDRDAVQTEISSAASAAAEGALVAHEVERDRTLRSFATIRTAELHKVAMNAADALQETPTEHGLQAEADRGARLANRIADLLERLHERPSDRELARHVRLKLDRLATDAGDVADSL